MEEKTTDVHTNNAEKTQISDMQEQLAALKKQVEGNSNEKSAETTSAASTGAERKAAENANAASEQETVAKIESEIDATKPAAPEADVKTQAELVKMAEEAKAGPIGQTVNKIAITISTALSAIVPSLPHGPLASMATRALSPGKIAEKIWKFISSIDITKAIPFAGAFGITNPFRGIAKAKEALAKKEAAEKAAKEKAAAEQEAEKEAVEKIRGAYDLAEDVEINLTNTAPSVSVEDGKLQSLTTPSAEDAATKNLLVAVKAQENLAGIASVKVEGTVPTLKKDGTVLLPEDADAVSLARLQKLLPKMETVGADSIQLSDKGMQARNPEFIFDQDTDTLQMNDVMAQQLANGNLNAPDLSSVRGRTAQVFENGTWNNVQNA